MAGIIDADDVWLLASPETRRADRPRFKKGIIMYLESSEYQGLLDQLEEVLSLLPSFECENGHILWTRHQTRSFDVAACRIGSTLLETGAWMEYGCTADWEPI
ncbi:MAG: hypothetical protein ACJ71Z_04605 [Aeromicrobium sp.]